MFIVAPSGMGKSVMSIQAAIEWSTGRDSFGIKPKRALKTLIVQAEDDEGDTIEMSQIAKYLNLTAIEAERFKANVWINQINNLTGARFLQALDAHLEHLAANWAKPDLVIMNPYTSFLGGEIKDDGYNNMFLRNLLNPLLTKHKCAAIIIHHTPKTNFRDTSTWRPSDWMYSGAGASCLTNWARAYLVIDPTSVHETYKFIAAKRGKRIGWGDHFPVFETYWSHCSERDKLLWIAATAEEIQAAAKSKKGVLLQFPCGIYAS
jgi:RecA-family ATPase